MSKLRNATPRQSARRVMSDRPEREVAREMEAELEAARARIESGVLTQAQIIRDFGTEIARLRDRLALAEPSHEACSAQVESLQRQLALAEQALADQKSQYESLLQSHSAQAGQIMGEMQRRIAAEQTLVDAGLREDRLRAEIADWEQRLIDALDEQLGLREVVEAARVYLDAAKEAHGIKVPWKPLDDLLITVRRLDEPTPPVVHPDP